MKSDSASRTSWIVCGSLSIAVIAVGVWLVQPPMQDQEFEQAKPVAGIRAVFRPQTEMKMAPNARILGLHVEGKPYAFVKVAFEAYDGHVVNMHSGSTAVSLVYCELFQCMRVMKLKNTSSRINLARCELGPRFLTVIYDGKEYEYHSKELPFEDIEYEETTWSEWMSRFPETMVYDGPRDHLPSGFASM